MSPRTAALLPAPPHFLPAPASEPHPRDASCHLCFRRGLVLSTVLPFRSLAQVGDTHLLNFEHLLVSVPATTVPLMSNAAPWAVTAGNKFRAVARATENPTTKLLAEGLTALTESLRELDSRVGQIENQIQSQ